MSEDFGIDEINESLCEQTQWSPSGRLLGARTLPHSSPATAPLYNGEKDGTLVDPQSGLIFPEDFWSVITRLELSLWRDLLPLSSTTGELNRQHLRRFRTLVAKAKLRLPSEEEFEAMPATDRETNTLEEWRDFLKVQHKALLNFLNQLVESHRSI